MAEDKHFMDKHRVQLIQRVKNAAAILDELLSENVIQQDSYEKIRALPTSQEIMRELFNRPLASSGAQGKEIFYKILNKHESNLMDDLKRTEYENAMKEETVMAKKMLFETLNDLSSEELDYFKYLIKLEEDYPPISRSRLKAANAQDTVELMVETYSEECVELTKKVLKEMNRADLVQRLSDTNSGSKEKQRPSLIQRVETIASVIELLLETLADLNDGEIEKFKEFLQNQTDFHKHWSDIQWRLLKAKDRQVIVFLMVQNDGQQSVKTTKEVLEKMKRTDLVQRLSDSSSGSKKKHPVDKRLSVLIHKVATMRAVKELLLETLSDLSYGELKKFKWLLQFTFFRRSLELVSWRRLLRATAADLVEVMLERCGKQSVEVTKEVLLHTNRADLVQRLLETSSGYKGKHCEDECMPALIHKVETMTSVIELLLETLAGLGDREISIFKHSLSQTNLIRRFSDISLFLLKIINRQDIVFLMVLTDGQQSVKTTKEVLEKMKRTDLVQRLSDSSSGSKKKHSDEHRSALIQKVATMAAVKQLLLEILNDLSNEELENFKETLELIVSQKDLPDIPPVFRLIGNRAKLVDVMLQTYSQQSVQLTREVVKKMNRTDLMQRLPKPSSEHEGLLSLNASDCEDSEEEHQPVLSEKAAVKWILLETLKNLSKKEFVKFKLLLQFTYIQKGLPHISWSHLDWADSAKALVDLMVENQQSVEVTKEVFMDMKRTDLVKQLSVISSRIKGPSGSLELEGCGSVTQDSSDWTKLDPEVNSTDADEAPTYRCIYTNYTQNPGGTTKISKIQNSPQTNNLQSEAGNFECSVSGLRWICKEKVSFKYQFCSLSGHMERIESMQYMPAGPLMDITVIAGKLDVVYLPHWIWIHDNSTILDKFAVLHIDDCGDVVEKVSEVTSSHVKLSEPVFSLKMVLVKYFGLSLEINCKVIIYKTDTPFLKLHVYLIPPDPALQEELEKIESTDGYRRIRKPHPVKPLKMNDWFNLTADLDGAKICPDALMLMYESTDPNFFEVLIKNPDTDFELKLKQENELHPVWTCKIQKDEYQSCARPTQGEHFVDKHRAQLIERVNNIASILDELLDNKVIQQGEYVEISAILTNRDKMRRLYVGPLNAAGHDGKDIFYKILKSKEPLLISDLKKKK